VNNWHLVFVYGTLMQKSGGIRSLDKIGDSAEYVCDTVTSSEQFEMLNLGHFPGVVDSASGHRVAGELWRVTSRVFRDLDIIEGYPDFYTRKMVPTDHGIAWMYYLPQNVYQDKHTQKITEKQGVLSWLDLSQPLSLQY
jgi:gamma-glutamylcyclotransferase (GGCT)/AIG2-like uncharacterized protein YtfP